MSLEGSPSPPVGQAADLGVHVDTVQPVQSSPHTVARSERTQYRATAGSDSGVRQIQQQQQQLQSSLSLSGDSSHLHKHSSSWTSHGKRTIDDIQRESPKKQRSLKSASASTASDIGAFSPVASPASSPPNTDTLLSASYPAIDLTASTPASAAAGLSVAYAPSAASTIVPTDTAQARELDMQKPEPPIEQQLPQQQQQHGHLARQPAVAAQESPLLGDISAAAPLHGGSAPPTPAQPTTFSGQSQHQSISEARNQYGQQNRSPGQSKNGASRTAPIIRSHGSSLGFSQTNRSHGPGHIPPTSPLTSSPPFTPNIPSTKPFQYLGIKDTTGHINDAPRHPVASPPTTTPGPPGQLAHNTSQPVIRPSSSPKHPPNISGRGNAPGRPAWVGGPGGGGPAFTSSTSSSPAKPFGGPAAGQPQPLQRADTFPSIPPYQQYGSTSVARLRYPNIELQPKTRPITLTQLVNEVKGIYVGLAMVESKCIEIDSESSAIDPQVKLDDGQWQALLNLHRTLLHEHHDFMLASQHPSASPALRRVAQKYAIPARMWRHGIHSFLELLRHRLPASREHMITFIYMAYSIIALLYETVRTFEDTWVECLGDLSRYRMAIEDDNQRVRDTWTNVSRRWYSLASDRAPTTGRLHHHLAILARPYVVTQLYYYVKSLCTPIPFTSTRESIMTLLDPVLNNATQHVPPIELAFIKAHAILFKNSMKTTPDFRPTVTHLLAGLDDHIALSARGWVETGVYMAIVNSCSLLAYGGDDNVLMRVLRDEMNRSAMEGDVNIHPDSRETSALAEVLVNIPADVPMAGMKEATHKAKEPVVADPEILKGLEPAQRLVTEMDCVVFSRVGDANCHGYIHARLVWMLCLARVPEGMAYVEYAFPWEKLVATLNNMLLTSERYDKIEQEVFMQPQVDRKAEEEKRIKEIQFKQQQQQQAAAAAGDNSPFVPTEPVSTNIPPMPPPVRSDADKPLPDDWFLRGLLWSEYNYPTGWFANMDSADEDEKLMESASTRLTRKERVLWMACRLAMFKTWITYDAKAHVFSVTEAFRTPLEDVEDDDEQAIFLDETAQPTGQDLDLDKAVPAMADTNMTDLEDKDSAKDTKKDIANGQADLDNNDYDDDSDTADFEDDNDTTDDVNFSDMEGMARAKVARLGQEPKKPP